MLALFAATAPLAAEDAEIARRRLDERKNFTDAEILEGFFKITFGAEFYTAGNVDRIRKYNVPVRVVIDSRARPDRRNQVMTAIDDIRRRIRHLDLAVTDNAEEANAQVILVRDRALGRTIRSVFGVDRGRRIQKSLQPQCLSGFRKDNSYRIMHSTVILAVDIADFTFFDCVYEELLQALGPINDDASVPWTMFNDEVQFGFFDVYDQYLLNILYHPRIQPGMTRTQAEAVMPDVMRDVRPWVAKINGLPN